MAEQQICRFIATKCAGKIDDAQFDAIASVSASQVDIDSSNNLDDRNNGGGVPTADIAVGASIVEAGPYYSDQYMRFQLTIATASQPAANIRLDFDCSYEGGLAHCHERRIWKAWVDRGSAQ